MLAKSGRVGSGIPRKSASPVTPDSARRLRPLDNTVIERVTFVATRAGAYQSPLAAAFRAALRMAASAVAAPGLPLEMFEPEYDIARPAGDPGV